MGFYLDLLRRYKEKYEMKILAYCLMGNYVHLQYNKSGRLWQNRFSSSVVEEELYLWAVMRYIE
jgi:putative transposase